MKKNFAFVLLLLAVNVYGQKFYTDLNGFRLGQYREATKNELGKPFQQGKYDDGYEYEVFAFQSGNKAYVVFEYTPANNNMIWSMQVSGDTSNKSIGFENVWLGMNEKQVINQFGNPSEIEDIGKYGKKWSYNSSNFSFEIKNGKLSSIKIIDYSSNFFPNPDLSKLPSFIQIRNAFNSNNNDSIFKWLAPDIQIHNNDTIHYLAKSFQTERTTDYSKVAQLIKDISKDLTTLNTSNADEYDENMRLTLNEDVKHVMKIKKGHIIKEIVFKYYCGNYKICEINI